MSTRGVCAAVIEKHFTQINLPPPMSFLDESPPNTDAMDGNRHIFASSFAKFLNLRHSLKPVESHSLAKHRKTETLYFLDFLFLFFFFFPFEKLPRAAFSQTIILLTNDSGSMS